MSAFTLPIDIINRGLQVARTPRINSLSEHSEGAVETVFLYDKLREAELQGNFWRFATKRVILRPIGIDSVIYTPPTWVAGTFSPGAIVSYSPTTGLYAGETFYWVTRAAKTASNTLSPELDPDWSRYTGPLAVDLYDTGSTGDTTTSYQAGELVLVPAAYAGGTTYAANAVVSSGTTWYVSLAAANLGNAVTDTTWWTPWTNRGRSSGSYGVTATDSPIPLTYPGSPKVYSSLYTNNEDNPASATGNWLDVTGSIATLQVAWPLGAGPSHDLSTSSVYRLPNAFLKKAPTDPKAALVPYLGAASGASPEDYVVEDQYLLSKQTAAGPVMLRFVASVIDVPIMDAMFCEMLAARIGEEGAASFKTLDPKLLPTVISKAIRSYKEWRRRATLANAIEIGPTAQVENRYVTVRA
jgi:hypothetical protein